MGSFLSQFHYFFFLLLQYQEPVLCACENWYWRTLTTLANIHLFFQVTFHALLKSELNYQIVYFIIQMIYSFVDSIADYLVSWQIFMLSAVSPMNMPAVLQNVRTIIKVSIHHNGHMACFLHFSWHLAFYHLPAKWLCAFSGLCLWRFCTG